MVSRIFSPKLLTMKKLLVILFISTLCASLNAQSQTNDKLPFSNGDKICIVGNSITHNGRYHSYIMMYYVTRFPQMRLSFVNCGISGDRAVGIYGRLDSDVFPNKPTVATLMSGMNDVNRGLYSQKNPPANAAAKQMAAIDEYKINLTRVAERYKQQGVRPVFISPSIYDQTMEVETENMLGVNDALKSCRDYVQLLAKSYNAPFIDMWTPMQRINTEVQKRDIKNTIVGSDRIHPRELGHMIMAYIFLSQSSSPRYVYNVEIDAASSKSSLHTATQENCSVTGLTKKGDKITFDNFEKALPFPIIEAAKGALDLVPFTDSLNAQRLQISGLKSGTYAVSINDTLVGQYTAGELAASINLSTNGLIPQHRRVEKITKLCDDHFNQGRIIRTLRMIEGWTMKGVDMADRAKVRSIVEKYRDDNLNNPNVFFKNSAQSYLDNMDREAEIRQTLQSLEDQIYSANQPQTYKYTIERVSK